MMDAKGVRNMYSILVVVNKHNTARVASCWFIIYNIIDLWCTETQIQNYLFRRRIQTVSGVHRVAKLVI